jgi:hypothetical protein
MQNDNTERLHEQLERVTAIQVALCTIVSIRKRHKLKLMLAEEMRHFDWLLENDKSNVFTAKT